MKQIFLGAAAGLVLVALVALLKYSQISAAIAEAAGRTPPPEAVTAAEAEGVQWPRELHAVGSLAPVQGAILGAEEQGRVVRIAFQSGALVQKGDVLVELDTSVEEARLRGAIAQAELSRLSLERAKALRQKNANSIADLDNAQMQYQNASAEVDTLKAQIARKKIVAPFAGRTGIRQVNEGQFVAAGTEIVSLQSLDPIYVNFSLPQQSLADVAQGAEVTIEVDAFPDTVFRGELTAINPHVDETTRTVDLQATLPNADERLHPGMFGRVTVGLKGTEELVAIPASSINFAPYGNTVFVIETQKDPTGAEYQGVRQQVVQLGRRRGDQIAVVSGLKAGEQVVSSGTFKLRAGAAVTVNNVVTPGNSIAPTPADT